MWEFEKDLYIKKVLRFIKVNKVKIISYSMLVLALSLLAYALKTEYKYTHPIYSEGEYVGIGSGYHSDIKVKIKTDKYRILSIEILEHQEMPVISEVVFKDIPHRVIRKNSTDIDLVSGATFTSKGLLEAIDEALVKAKIKPEENQ